MLLFQEGEDMKKLKKPVWITILVICIAVIIGGTTFAGGSGTYEGSIAGSLVMVLLSNLLTALNPTQPVRNVLNAVILILLLVLYNRGKAIRQ